MQSIYNYKTHIRKNINNCKKNKSINLPTQWNMTFLICKIANYKNAWQHVGIQWFSCRTRTHVKFSHIVNSRKSANKPSTRCIHTACHKLLTGLEQPCRSYCTCCKVVLTSPLHAWYDKIVTTLCWQPCNILLHHGCNKLVSTVL
jgi:hypothetical protein